MQIRLTIITLLLSLSLSTFAQASQDDVRQMYNRAEEQYNNGQFAECQNTVHSLLPSADATMRANSYRLLALCAIEQGDIPTATQHTQRLLNANPYFTTNYNDPQRFVDIINELKSSAAGITTASKQAETIEEAPVPVTLITEDMIRHSGTQSLAELLCLYVPGMTMSEGPETSVAMRGTYSLLQDKILVLIDGHRLNSNVTNSEALDFRTSLDKVERIEVLRGPASSLYGNTALTAAVNIITKKGAQLNGGTVSGTIGTQNTYGGQFVVGGGNNAMDIMGWGSVYYSKGFAHSITNYEGQSVNLYSNAYNGKPSYDLGLKARWNDFTITLNMQHSKKVPYLNFMQIPGDLQRLLLYDDTDDYKSAVLIHSTNQVKNFDISRYASIDGNRPGFSRTNSRLNVDYSHEFGKVSFQASAYASLEKSTYYNSMGDSINNSIANAYLVVVDESGYLHLDNKYKGFSNILDWSAITIGGQAQIQTDYNLLGKGTLTAGLQYEHFSINGSKASIVANYGDQSKSYSFGNLFNDGAEITYSAYAQTKHLFSQSVIMNAGIRYDMHHRQNGRSIMMLSPRISMVFKLNKSLSLRTAYSLSNADAPYLYRTSRLTILNGGELDPEKMHSIQLSLSYNSRKNPFKAELNFFCNMVNSFITFKPEGLFNYNEKTYYVMAQFFANVGTMRTMGCELSASYLKPRFYATANITAQTINAATENDLVYNNTTAATPHCFGNIVVAGAPYCGKGKGFFHGGKLWLRSTVSGQSQTWYSNTDWPLLAFFPEASETYTLHEWHNVHPQFTFGLGVSYETKWLDFDLSLKNLTNNQYNLGSVLTDGIPRAGRQFLGKITFKF